jgi:hypothetical protein
MTVSQLGMFLIRRDHPYATRFREQWAWFTYFLNALAARTFLRLDLADLQAADQARRVWVADWLAAHGLPSVSTGSYYVKAFRLQGEAPATLQPLVRDGLVRPCFRPPLD